MESCVQRPRRLRPWTSRRRRKSSVAPPPLSPAGCQCKSAHWRAFGASCQRFRNSAPVLCHSRCSRLVAGTPLSSQPRKSARARSSIRTCWTAVWLGSRGCHRDDPPDARCPARIRPVEQDDVADPDVLSLGRPQRAVVGHEDHHGKLSLLLDPGPHCHSHCRSGGHSRTELGRHRQMEGPHQPPQGRQCGTHIGHRPACELEEEQ